MRWLWLGAVLVACGKGDPKDSNASGPVYTSDWEGVAQMLDDRCVTCHAEGGQAAAYPFPETIQLDVLEGAGDFVVAGQSAASRLWLALESGQMPAQGGPLAGNERDHVKAWIDAGAPNDFDAIDFDGDGATTATGDCDERSAAVGPNVPEVCGDGLDNDCSGDADGIDAINAIDWFPDGDGDGYGGVGGTATRSCEAPTGHADSDTDCADGDPAIHPGQAEVADGVDQDCDGFVDEATSFATDLEPLFPSYCSCHVSGLAGVMLLSSESYLEIVDAPSVQLPTMDLVEPFDLENSYLWHKLNGTQATVGGTGDAMPQGALPLSYDQLAAIEAWILEGAPP